MRRLQLALALLVVPFGAGVAVAVLTRSENRTRTVELTTTKVEVINGSRRAGRVPAPIPTLVEGSTDPHGLALSNAVPIDANLDSADYVERRPRQLIVSWDRVHFTRNGQSAIWQRRGIAIWQLDRGNAASWHRVYTYETPVNNQVNLVGFSVSLGDISGDRRPEILVFFDTDGSAGVGTASKRRRVPTEGPLGWARCFSGSRHSCSRPSSCLPARPAAQVHRAISFPTW